MTLERIVKDLERRVDLYREESRKRRCPELFYRSRGLYEALAMLTASLDGRPEILTLKELTCELRKIFKFKYLTVSNTNGCCINVWKYFKPEWNESDEEWIGCYLAFDIYPDELICELDFSEYVDADGDVDFSKCIVEVTDDIN